MIPGVVASQIVGPAMATAWSYLGLSGSHNGTYSYMNAGAWCDSSATTLTKLTSARPPSGYEVGYVIRVSHAQDDLTPCTTYFYIAV